MSIIEYLKERIPFIIINLVLFFIVAILMSIANVPRDIIIIVFSIWFLPVLSYILIELIKSKKYFDDINNALDNLDKKYLLPEVIEEADFVEGRVLRNILKTVSKDMNERVKYFKDEQLEYREYIETWVHEIKTPIASAKLILENDDNNLSERVTYEIKRVENYIDQVLYYARSSDVSKDYIIKEFDLRAVVMKSIKANSRDFINKKIKLDLKEVSGKIFSDTKWIEFIINQIIVNAIKFSEDNKGIVEIYSKEYENNIVLTIKDNGVGISEKDIGRVFEKGFTGENGRLFGKSTGIGLYLCKKLCSKLGLGINITSKQNEGTKVNIVFPKGRFTEV